MKKVRFGLKGWIGAAILLLAGISFGIFLFMFFAKTNVKKQYEDFAIFISDFFSNTYIKTDLNKYDYDSFKTIATNIEETTQNYIEDNSLEWNRDEIIIYFLDFIGGLVHRTYNEPKDYYEYSYDYEIYKKNKQFQDDEFVKSFSLNYNIPAEKVYDSFYYGNDYYICTLIFEGEEVKKALKGQTNSKIRYSAERTNEGRQYTAVPIYLNDQILGCVVVSARLFVTESLDFMRAKNDFISYFSFCGLIFIFTILFFILLIVHPITKLSKQTSSVLDKTGKITTTDFAYKKRRDEIGDLSRSFSTLIKKINDQMQAVEANTSDMVHEFKNPLAAIRSSMELLDFDDMSGEERKEILDSVHSELRHLEVLLNDIRTHSKIQNLNNEADKENVPVGILTENVISRIRKNYPAVDFEFICENREDSIFVKPENLDKMIGNLVENAASFAVNSEKKQVLVRIKSIKDIHKIKTIMRIDVEDSGPGVPESEIEKIFGRYYSHREDSQRKEHSGLGLSMVKAVADSLNATISVLKSGKLGGAKFVISIPLFDEVEEIKK